MATKKWRSFNEAREFVRGAWSDKFRNWGEFVESGLIPEDIPVSPEQAYSDSGWDGFVDFTGCDQARAFQIAVNINPIIDPDETEGLIPVAVCMGRIILSADKYGSLDSFSFLNPAMKLWLKEQPSLDDVYALDYPAYPLSENGGTDTIYVYVRDVNERPTKSGCKTLVYVFDKDETVVKTDNGLTYATLSPLDTVDTINEFGRSNWSMVRSLPDPEELKQAREVMGRVMDNEFSELLE